MFGSKEQISKDIESFNRQYVIGKCLANSANGVLYNAKRKSDNLDCVIKVR